MTFDTVKRNFNKEHLWIAEIIVDGLTYRFCENRSPLPIGLQAIPTLTGASTNPTVANIAGGLGVRASASVTFNDHTDYTQFANPAGVRFWPRWRARHPYYQGARLRLLSGYIIGNQYLEENFTAREYVIETWGYSGGKVSISAKDPLKLADNDRSQAPRATTVTLTLDALAAATTLTVNDTADFTAGDYVRIGEEVLLINTVTSATELAVTRAQYNTFAADHKLDDAVQLCLQYSNTLPEILYDLMVNYAGIDPAFIPLSRWNDEADLWLPGLYETLITEPVGVQDLLKELTEQAPHYLFWDERSNAIEMIAIKQPPDESLCLTDEANIIQGSIKVVDKNDMRISRVIVHFGQFDPTKKLDEFSNYRQTYVRVDTDSETNYGTSKLKTIYSRWINNSNKAAAVRLSARIGRRFATAPRAVTFALDAKDADVWTGTPCQIDTADIVDNLGNRYCMPVQVTSAVERQQYQYEALEHTYGPATPDDEAVDQPGKVVILSGELLNINLRDIFDTLFPSVLAGDNVVFIFDSACTAGSTTNNASVNTGSWPELTEPPLIDVRGLLIGKGGDGAQVDAFPNPGGIALALQNDVRISNTGILAGGGGGGGYDEFVGGFTEKVTGGGGAGFNIGLGGFGSFSTGSGFTIDGQNSTKTLGGAGGFSDNAFGGAGGGLGLPGGDTSTQSGGAAGAAIQTNGYTITYTGSGAGDIRGAIL